MVRNKTELNELKIKYNKLSKDNENNNIFLSKILNIRNNKKYTTKELLEKMKNYKLYDKDNKKIIK